MVRVKAYFPGYFDDIWVGHSCKSILDGMQSAGASTSLTTLCKAAAVRDTRIRGVIPPKLFKFFSPARPLGDRLAEGAFVRSIRPGDIAYLWLDSPTELIDRVRKRGAMAVREMVNCTRARRRFELQRAYELLKWPCSSSIRDAEIQRERNQLLDCDAVFCPNPFVRESVEAYGVAPERCIDCSYGWSEDRIRSHSHVPNSTDNINVLFVGTVDVRKGAPWLLQAWAKVKMKGTLYLAGNVDKEVAERGASWLRQHNVRALGHVDNISNVYDTADIFVFPSWEEGGPMVTLEAMAQGIPCIVTPMGTSGVVTDREGIIVEPGSVDALAEALWKLAADPELRQSLGNAGYEKVRQYTWTKVGERRLQGLYHNMRATCRTA